ncbi:hypothetical protein GCM10009422_12280 [Brevundimonas kwangchunensis]|uniref:Uncharacterized protein n=1 Tax=Brevundimonas kwangchunensis TaxID=322163 RepID=A0ABN1GSS5_9CAUL
MEQDRYGPLSEVLLERAWTAIGEARAFAEPAMCIAAPARPPVSTPHVDPAAIEQRRGS